MTYIMDLFYLVPLLFIAGVLDGIAGGGGIIALPAYLLTGMPVHSAYACNKLQSGFGTMASGMKYIKEDLADLKASLIALPAAAANMLGSYFGAAIAVKKGEKIVFPAMLAVVAMLVIQTLLGAIGS